MSKLLLSVHVLAAILAVGPVTVAASTFPPAARAALRDPADAGSAARAGALHRVCRVYAGVGLFVPAFGVATAASLGVLGDPWVVAAMALTLAAAGLLVLRVLPAQRSLVTAIASRSSGAAADADATTASTMRRLPAAVGVFNLLWAVVVVLMIVRPGSTTGA